MSVPESACVQADVQAQDAESDGAQSPPWKARFFTIWTGQAFSLVGSSLVRFAIIWWLTEETGSATVLAMANLAAFLPIVVMGPVMGALIDRWSRRWIMAIADGTVALLTALLALLYWLGVIEVWHVYVLLFLRALGEAFHEPAMTASTTLMVPKEQLTRVAGMNQARQSLTFLAGPVLGALLVELLSIPGVLAIDVLTALPAIGPLLFLAVPQPPPTERDAADADARQRNPWQALLGETTQGFRYLWGWRGVFVLLMTTSLIVFFQRPAISFMPLLITQHFGGGPREMGWISAAFNVGSVSGGILLSAWGGFRLKIVNMVVALVAYGLLSLARGLTPPDGFWFLVGATLLGGLANPMFFASLRAMLQSTVPPDMQGRVFATQSSLVMAMGPLGLAILGPLADGIGIQTLFVLSGVACLLVALSWVLTPSVRRAEDGPPGEDGPLVGAGPLAEVGPPE